MGNCFRQDRRTALLTHPYYTHQVSLSILVKNPACHSATTVQASFELLPPVHTSFHVTRLAEQLFTQSAAVLPGQDPRTFLDRDCQDAFCSQQGQHSFLTCVFDGHGPHGCSVVKFAMTYFTNFYSARENEFLQAPSETIQSMAAACDEMLLTSDIDVTYSGTTALIVLLTASHIHVGTIGDSRALCAVNSQSLQPVIPKTCNKYTRQTEPAAAVSSTVLSSEQVPDNLVERSRIEEAGGCVHKLLDEFGEEIGPLRVWQPGLWGPGLAMTRSLGDSTAKTLGVICTPDVQSYPIGSTAFLVLASDGLWDVMHNQEVVNFVEKFRSKAARRPVSKCEYPVTLAHANIAQLIAEEARYRWFGVCEAEDVPIDDIAVSVVEIHSLAMLEPKSAQSTNESVGSC